MKGQKIWHQLAQRIAHATPLMRRRYALAGAGGLVTLSTLVSLGFGSGTQADLDPRIVRERQLVAKAVKPLFARVDIINALNPSGSSSNDDQTEIFDMVVSRLIKVEPRVTHSLIVACSYPTLAR